MAFSLQSGPFWLKEGTLEVGTVTNPQNIGQNNTDPRTFFTGTPLGYIRQGTINISLTREFAEFIANTPGILIRKDLIRKQFALEFEVGQFDGDVMERLNATTSQKGYSVTTPSAQTWDLHHIGSDEPTLVEAAYMLEATLTNGWPIIVMVYAGKMTAEDISKTLAGTDYAVNTGRIEAFVHSGFTTAQADKHYGLMAVKTA
jgi:hypothetical protein